MRTHLTAPTLALLLATAPLWAQDKPSKGPADQEATHKELRAFREGLTDAILKGDVERQLDYVSKDVVVTWQNGVVARGHQGLKDFLAQHGPGKVFKGYKTPPTPEELTILYGDDTGISYGTSVAQYSLLGKEFELKNHWSATLVREDGRWKIANYHVSANVLDNPLLNAAKGTLYWAGGIALAVGLLGGFLVGRLWRRPGPGTP
jgi:ketosteroid isomerase-like protein